MSTDPPLFELAAVSFAYPGGADALSDVTLRVAEGRAHAILGPNGCGKSTLLRLLLGLETPRRGTVRFRGRPLDRTALADRAFSRSLHLAVGFLFQDPTDQLFSPTVAEEIAFGPVQLSLSDAEVGARVGDVIRLCRLEALRDRSPLSLSVGERKRVALAAILATSPSALVLDEPFAGLDEENQQWLESFLVELRAAGRTLVFATHDRGFATRLADTVFPLSRDHHLVVP